MSVCVASLRAVLRLCCCCANRSRFSLFYYSRLGTPNHITPRNPTTLTQKNMLFHYRNPEMNQLTSQIKNERQLFLTNTHTHTPTHLQESDVGQQALLEASILKLVVPFEDVVQRPALIARITPFAVSSVHPPDTRLSLLLAQLPQVVHELVPSGLDDLVWWSHQARNNAGTFERGGGGG